MTPYTDCSSIQLTTIKEKTDTHTGREKHGEVGHVIEFWLRVLGPKADITESVGNPENEKLYRSTMQS